MGPKMVLHGSQDGVLCSGLRIERGQVTYAHMEMV